MNEIILWTLAGGLVGIIVLWIATAGDDTPEDTDDSDMSRLDSIRGELKAQEHQQEVRRVRGLS